MNQTLPRMHFTAPYLLHPPNPITINLIGAGGTGSQVLTSLTRIHSALIALNHPGLMVTVWDGDTVSEANLGRQLFAVQEVGQLKAVALINRTNRFFGTYWKAVPHMYIKQTLVKLGSKGQSANLTISCVDTVSARFSIAEILNDLVKVIPAGEGPKTPFYWMDFGNSQNTGQVILSTVGTQTQPTSTMFSPVARLPFVTDEYGDTLTQSETADNTPSCSLAEALQKQDLLINTTLANMGCTLLWNMLHKAMTDTRGIFLNLAKYRTQPLSV